MIIFFKNYLEDIKMSNYRKSARSIMINLNIDL